MPAARLRRTFRDETREPIRRNNAGEVDRDQHDDCNGHGCNLPHHT